MFTAPVRFLIGTLLTVSIVFGGKKLVTYFRDQEAPEITLVGIDHEGYYAGDVACILTLQDAYKISEFSLFIDQKPLVTHVPVNKRQIEHHFTAHAGLLDNGPHELRVEAVDAAYNKNRAEERIRFFVDNEPLQAVIVRPESDIKIFQGKTLHLFVQTNKHIKTMIVKTLGQEFIAVPEEPNSRMYECFIPISCTEKPNEYALTIDVIDHVGNRLTLESKFQVVLFPFPQQKLTLSKEVIEAEQAAGKEQDLFEQRIVELTQQSPARKLWKGSFYSPMNYRTVSTAFGTVRETQHRGKYAHKAVDFTGTPKQIVWAPQDGVIVLKDRYAMSGNTIVIDHGCGVLSLYFHLETYGSQNVGDTVKQGNPIGTMGKTGFASGYHLHWEMRVNTVAVDPLQWISHEF